MRSKPEGTEGRVTTLAGNATLAAIPRRNHSNPASRKL